MSKQLLHSLNGNNVGRFNEWLNSFEGEPRIAWYPSSGHDFEPLLYLSPGFAEIFKIRRSIPSYPKTPHVFIYTDYHPYPWTENPSFLDDRVLHRDERSVITANSIEELPRCDLPVSREHADFPEGSPVTGRVVFLEVEIESVVGGKFSTSVIYAFVENNAFYRMQILRNNAVLSHMFYKRYGESYGGAASSGKWLLDAMWGLQCECIITNMNKGDLKSFSSRNDMSSRMDGDLNTHDFDDLVVSSAISDDGTIERNPMIGLPPYLITKQFLASADDIDGKPVRKQILMVPPWLGLGLDEAIVNLQKDKQTEE